MTDRDQAILKLVQQAIQFADLAAGEGIFFDECDPALVLCDACNSLDLDDWSELSKVVADRMSVVFNNRCLPD